ncbi:hypothetical protein BDV93DRAFT_445390, partial [Ceratobasidium sp. AG-I]
LLSIVLDNASSNDTLVNQLSQRVPSFRGNKSRVRCAAHVINLMVKVRSFALTLPFSSIYITLTITRRLLDILFSPKLRNARQTSPANCKSGPEPTTDERLVRLDQTMPRSPPRTRRKPERSWETSPSTSPSLLLTM